MLILLISALQNLHCVYYLYDYKLQELKCHFLLPSLSASTSSFSSLPALFWHHRLLAVSCSLFLNYERFPQNHPCLPLVAHLSNVPSWRQVFKGRQAVTSWVTECYTVIFANSILPLIDYCHPKLPVFLPSTYIMHLI